jgi:hypothetical protein
MRRRILGLALAALMLYGVAPAVVDVLGGWRDLNRVSPAWWAAAALQYRMLAQAGLPAAGIATGLAAGSLLLLGALCALPILAVPLLIAGRRIPTGLLEAGAVSLVVFACLRVGAQEIAGPVEATA